VDDQVLAQSQRIRHLRLQREGDASVATDVAQLLLVQQVPRD
jgi:hypothetical protein